MRMWRLFVGLAVVAGVLGAVVVRLTVVSKSGQAKGADATKEADDAPPAFAVVELFTSEGCSSCPPADAVLAECVQDAREHGKRVYCLAFQVDYWNRLGWADPYSDAAFTRRQNGYAQTFSSNQVYTPQMIVNGTEEFVGSERERSRKSIDAALKRPAKALVKLREEKGGEKENKAGAVIVSYESSAAPKGAVVNIAVVERGLVSKVARGENADRTLHHENVVRVFRTVPLDETAKGSVELKLPTDLVQKNASVIAYVQETAGGGSVLGANAIDLGPAESK